MVAAKLQHRLLIAVVTVSIGFSAFSFWAFHTLLEQRINGPLYLSVVQGKDLIADILPPPEYILESNLVAFQLMAAAESREIDPLAQRLGVLRSEYDQRHTFWEKESLDSETKDLLLKQAHEPALKFFELAEKALIPALRASDRPGAQSKFAEMQTAYGQHRAAIDKVVARATARNAEIEKDAESAVRTNVVVLAIILLFTMVSAFIFALKINAAVIRRLGCEPEEAAAIAHRIATGDLNSPIAIEGTASDSLARALHAMQSNLRTLLGDIGSLAERLASASAQLSVVTTQSSRGLERQQAETDQVATAVTEMSATVREVAGSATRAAEAAGHATTDTAAGQTRVQDVRRSIDALATDVDAVAQLIQRLANDSASIGSVVDVINGIAEQTNLLALNAAIEAARAGEQGRGFAVVADEVRTLASRTQQSTQEIHKMVQSLQNVTKQVVDATERGRVRAQESVKQAAAAQGSLEQITDSVSTISDMNTQIATAAEQQSAVAEEINRNVANIRQVSQETSHGASQTAQASGELAKLASDLRSQVGRFRL